MSMSLISGRIFDFLMYPLERTTFSKHRKRLLADARGEVLEIGAGTGVNLAWYRPGTITRLVLTSISIDDPFFRRRAYSFSRTTQIPVHIGTADVENLPYADNTFDTVVATLLFCSVDHPEKGIREIYRVLKPGGIFLYLEHILPDRKLLSRFMKSITPFWKRIAGGCRLDRKTDTLIERSGFTAEYSVRDGYGIIVAGKAGK